MFVARSELLINEEYDNFRISSESGKYGDIKEQVELIPFGIYTRKESVEDSSHWVSKSLRCLT
jgi:hypothetical protein